MLVFTRSNFYTFWPKNERRVKPGFYWSVYFNFFIFNNLSHFRIFLFFSYFDFFSTQFEFCPFLRVYTKFIYPKKKNRRGNKPSHPWDRLIRHMSKKWKKQNDRNFLLFKISLNPSFRAHLRFTGIIRHWFIIFLL